MKKKKEIVKKEDKTDKCCNCLIYLIAVLLTASIFFNGWLLNERSETISAPENWCDGQWVYPHCTCGEECGDAAGDHGETSVNKCNKIANNKAGELGHPCHCFVSGTPVCRRW